MIMLPSSATYDIFQMNTCDIASAFLNTFSRIFAVHGCMAEIKVDTQRVTTHFINNRQSLVCTLDEQLWFEFDTD